MRRKSGVKPPIIKSSFLSKFLLLCHCFLLHLHTLKFTEIKHRITFWKPSSSPSSKSLVTFGHIFVLKVSEMFLKSVKKLQW